MAATNPTGDERAVPLDLPDDHITILRDHLTAWLMGVRQDLRAPERLEDSGRVRQEAQAYERLLVALTTGQLIVPDNAAMVVLREAADADDKENGYTEIAANHDAFHGLLALLTEGGER
ncbi:MAG: hypothetical protein WA687_02700 [Solirubrobacterales bacterium]